MVPNVLYGLSTQNVVLAMVSHMVVKVFIVDSNVLIYLWHNTKKIVHC